MKNKNMKAIIIASVLLAANAVIGAEVPKNWFAAGSHPKDYEMSVDRMIAHDGKSSAQLKSVAPKPGGFGTLMQKFNADSFRGQRVRMSGYVRAEDIADWAGLWMRIDGAKGEALGFDNMQKRPIKGSSDWTRYEIVLDVPDEAKEIAFGLLLSGKGQAWMDDLNFEAVGKDVPTTGSGSSKKGAAKGPANLNFESENSPRSNESATAISSKVLNEMSVAEIIAATETCVARVEKAGETDLLLEMGGTLDQINEYCDQLQGKNKNTAPSAKDWNVDSDTHQKILKLLAEMENAAEGMRSVASQTKMSETERIEMIRRVWNEQFAKNYAAFKAILSSNQ